MYDERDYSLLEHNTFGMDVRCRRYVEFSSVVELVNFVSEGGLSEGRFMTIGRGSNLLFTGDYDGTVLHSAIKGSSLLPSTVAGKVNLRVGSGETWDDVVSKCVENGWYGAENLSFIPGEVGASAVQNIGAYGAEVKDLITEVEAVDTSTGSVVTLRNADCHYGYRDSAFKHEWKDKYVITHVTYRLSATFSPNLDYGNISQSLSAQGVHHPTARQLRDAIIEMRKNKLPNYHVLGNAGSFFKNPVVDLSKYESLSTVYPDMPHYAVDAAHVKIPAAWMIEKCGWKGRAEGRAGVYPKQSLVLVNLGWATGKDVVALCNKICADVHDMFGLTIEPEVNII